MDDSLTVFFIEAKFTVLLILKNMVQILVQQPQIKKRKSYYKKWGIYVCMYVYVL